MFHNKEKKLFIAFIKDNCLMTFNDGISYCKKKIKGPVNVSTVLNLFS